MSKAKILTLFTLTLWFILQGQSKFVGEVTYEIFHDKTLIETDNSNRKEGVKGANTLIKNASNVLATLKFNDKESSYKLNKKLKVDKIDDINITYIFAGGENLFYYHKDSISLLQSNTSLGKTLLIKRDIPNWILTKETKKIEGLTCTKAYTVIRTTNKETSETTDKIGVVAWFCPDIPISYGPREYFGLPGLIIELKSSKLTFIVKKIDFNKKMVVIDKPEKAEIITIEDFNVLARKSVPSFFEN